MNIRMNAGYIITDSVRVGKEELLLGIYGEPPKRFATGICKGGKDYCWDHHHSDLLLATKDLLERATQELEFCLRERAQDKEPTPALREEPEEPCL